MTPKKASLQRDKKLHSERSLKMGSLDNKLKEIVWVIQKGQVNNAYKSIRV